MMLAAMVPATAASAADDTLKIYLMIGQSNMVGQAPAFQEGDDLWAEAGPTGLTSIEYLLNNATYRNGLDANVFSSLSNISTNWLSPRDDAWAVHYDSSNGSRFNVQTEDGLSSEVDFTSDPRTLRPGFGTPQQLGITRNGVFNYHRVSMFGPELAMGHNLGNAMQSPVFLFKSDRGGTDLAVNWRPPSSGGDTGANYTNTVTQFNAILASLDADLQDNGVLDDYGNATGYEVAGLVWMQGWNTASGSQAVYTTEEKIAQYADNLVNLVSDLRADTGQAGLPAIIVESADANDDLNLQRQAAVDTLNNEIPGSAAFVETGDIQAITQHYHYGGRAEAYIEIGWRIGDAVIDNGYTGSEVVPEPASLTLMGVGGLLVLRRRR